MASLLQQPRIVVVGAGMAGLSAAVHLVEHGFTDVIVLEASERIGGRIHTVQFGESEYPIELGANWIHGSTLDNSTFELANKLDLLRPYRLQNRYSCRFLKEDGTEIDRETVKHAWQLFQNSEARIRTQVPKLNKESSEHTIPLSIESVLEKALKEEIVLFRQKDSANERKIPDILKAFNPMINGLSFHEGDELAKVSWDMEYVDHPGGNIHIPKGYCQLLQYLVRKLPSNCLRLNSEVRRLKLIEDSRRFTVTLMNGSILMADHVIVTCSLGFLKKNNRLMFEPPLPDEKRNAIERLGFGRVNKIFLEFDDPITKHKDIAFVWDHTYIGKDKREWYRKIFGFEKVFTRDNTLLGWIHGDAAEHMETLTNQEIGETCVKLLRLFLQDPSIPYPKDVMVSRWCSDLFSCGSYSYISSNFKPGDQNVLAEPILSKTGVSRLLFAGEATVQDQYGCTHAARSSGIREAERLCDIYLKKQKNQSNL